MSPVTDGAADTEIEQIIEIRFPDLSPRLQQAARYIVDHPRDVALHSMRAVAGRAHVDPSSMVRLAQELGFEGYENLRDKYRAKLLAGEGAWSERAKRIQRRRPTTGTQSLIHEMLDQDRRNLETTFSSTTIADFERCIDIIKNAGSLYVVGLRSLYPVAFYFHYACRLFNSKSILLTGTGGTFADDLRLARPDDAMLVFSYRPYAREAIRATEFVKKEGAKVIGVTDSKLSPIAKQADVGIIVANDSSSLLPSITPFFAVAQALATLLVLEGGDQAIERIARSEGQLSSFRVYHEQGRKSRTGR